MNEHDPHLSSAADDLPEAAHQANDAELVPANSDHVIETPEAVAPAAAVATPTNARRNRFRRPLLIGAAAAVVLVTAGGGAYAAMTKDVTVVVDGQTKHISTLAGTVSGALASAGLAAQSHDTLAPAGSAEVSNGSTIVLDRGRKLTLTIDGQQKEFWTTARTVDQALDQLGVRAAAGADLELSANRSRAIPVDGLAVTGTSLRPVSVSVAGAAAVTQQTSATTVGALLAERKITLGAHDLVRPALTTPLTAGLTVTVDRVTLTSTSTTVVVPKPADKKVNDAALDQGISKVVQQGAAGSLVIRYQVTTVNGRQTAKTETARTVVKKAQQTVIHVGTRKPTPGSAADAAAAAKKFTYSGVEVLTHDTTFGVNWDGLSMCESTHNPKAVNANPSAGLPTYGLFQFDIPTWESVGGSGNPMDATPSEQLMRAKLLYLQRGLEPWACRDAAH